MTTWILVLYLVGGSITTVPQQFASEQACQAAGKVWERTGGTERFKFMCLPILHEYS